jgi:hypothetical protein
MSEITDVDNFKIQCIESLHLRNKKQFKTLHSLFMFEQTRNDKHEVTFTPKLSTVEKKSNKYNFSPKFTIKDKLYFKSLEKKEKKLMIINFYKNHFKFMKGCKIIFIDESSMMKELEFEYIKYICKILKVKIIFLGDKYQLPPVSDIESNENDKNDKNDKNDENDNKNIDETIENETFNLIFSPAVTLKDNYTLTTIKRTSDPVLQEVYKVYRDAIENVSEGKMIINNPKNIQYRIKNVNSSDTYLTKRQDDKIEIVDYIINRRLKNENIRALCFTNNEVDTMNYIIRNRLYDNPKDKYLKGEKLLVKKYMCLPKFTLEQFSNIKKYLNHDNKKIFNYILKTVISLDIFDLEYTEEELSIINEISEIFKDFNLKNDSIKLYTSEILEITDIVKRYISVKKRTIEINIIFCKYENNTTFFIHYVNENDWKLINESLSEIKNNIKKKCSLYKLHKCSKECKEKCDSYHSTEHKCKEKCNISSHHYCDECDAREYKGFCPHDFKICDENCNLVCQEHDTCDFECDKCKSNHKNNYSQHLWNENYDYISYMMKASVDYSYATTVHKSQGQSIDNVIVCEYNITNCILNNSKIKNDKTKILLYLTCMYTAVTRSKKILARLK